MAYGPRLSAAKSVLHDLGPNIFLSAGVKAQLWSHSRENLSKTVNCTIEAATLINCWATGNRSCMVENKRWSAKIFIILRITMKVALLPYSAFPLLKHLSCICQRIWITRSTSGTQNWTSQVSNGTNKFRLKIHGNTQCSINVSLRSESGREHAEEFPQLHFLLSFLPVFHGGNSTFINSYDKTKFSYFTLPPTQHLSFFRN